MSDDEIEQTIRDAEQYASKDETRRQLLNIQNDAAKLIRKVENALTQAGKKIGKAEKAGQSRYGRFAEAAHDENRQNDE